MTKTAPLLAFLNRPEFHTDVPSGVVLSNGSRGVGGSGTAHPDFGTTHQPKISLTPTLYEEVPWATNSISTAPCLALFGAPRGKTSA